MKRINKKICRGAVVALSALLILITAQSINSHCDSEDGPILPEARRALETGDPSPLLKWVAPENEIEIKTLFAEVRQIRSESDDARKIVDRYFLETFIRLHRQSEGEPYTGIKPTGLIPAIFKAGDAALNSEDVQQLADEISKTVRSEIVSRFNTALERKRHMDDNVEAGRKYVEAYVSYMHFLEGLHHYLENGSAAHHTGDEHGESH
jgi:hypothetical protein